VADDIWQHREEALRDEDVIGFDAVAEDGPAGTVRATGYSAGRTYVIVTLAHDEPGRDVAVPIGLVAHLDLEGESLRLRARRHELLACPSHEPGRESDPDYLESLVAYWGERPEPSD
jgi:hypothetical protein